jgi:hypothetical protein
MPREVKLLFMLLAFLIGCENRITIRNDPSYLIAGKTLVSTCKGETTTSLDISSNSMRAYFSCREQHPHLLEGEK